MFFIILPANEGHSFLSPSGGGLRDSRLLGIFALRILTMLSFKKRRLKMKKIIFLLILIFLSPVYAFCEDIGYLRSSLIEGDVQVNTEYITEWLPLSVNVPIREKDKIWVPDNAKAEFNTRDGSYIRLNEYSSLDVISVERDFLRFYIPSGHLYVNYKGQRDGMLQCPK
jgi:hypothetical protein